jgi:hypothetical protein
VGEQWNFIALAQAGYDFLAIVIGHLQKSSNSQKKWEAKFDNRLFSLQ